MINTTKDNDGVKLHGADGITERVISHEVKKLTPFYVNIPVAYIVAESEKNVLVDILGKQFWIAKKFVKKNELNQFAIIIQLTLFKEYSYTSSDDKRTLTGEELYQAALTEYAIYNFKKLEKK